MSPSVTEPTAAPTAEAGDEPPTPSPSPSTIEDYRPSDLVGVWAVKAKGEPRTTRLVVRLGDMAVWRRCGVVSGGWRADRTGILMPYLTNFSGRCIDEGRDRVDWVNFAVTYRTTGRSVELLAADGEVLATLTAGDRPFIPDTIAASEAEVPRLTGRQRRLLDRGPEPVPTGMMAVTPDSVLGTWALSTAPRDSELAGFVTLTADGQLRGDDGCNRAYGNWRISAIGQWLTVGSGARHMAMCGEDPVSAIAGAAGLAIDGEELVALDLDGSERARLRRAQEPARAKEFS